MTVRPSASVSLTGKPALSRVVDVDPPLASSSPVGWLIELKLTVVVRPSGSVTLPAYEVESEPLSPGAKRPLLSAASIEVVPVSPNRVSLVNRPKLL
jgi:hypothetical protein